MTAALEFFGGFFGTLLAIALVVGLYGLLRDDDGIIG